MDHSTKFQNELLKDERVLWVGRPGSALFARADLFLVPFSILCCEFSIFWEVTVWTGFGGHNAKPAPPFFKLFGIPFVSMGLYFLVGRFFYKSWRNKRTSYAVTNKRVLILTETSSRRVRAAFLHQIPAIEKSIRADGTGTLTFGGGTGFGGMSGMYENTGLEVFGGMHGSPPPTFHSIPDAEQVYRLVSEQLGR